MYLQLITFKPFCSHSNWVSLTCSILEATVFCGSTHVAPTVRRSVKSSRRSPLLHAASISCDNITHTHNVHWAYMMYHFKVLAKCISFLSKAVRLSGHVCVVQCPPPFASYLPALVQWPHSLVWTSAGTSLQFLWPYAGHNLDRCSIASFDIGHLYYATIW